jgi:hypothetical protein
MVPAPVLSRASVLVLSSLLFGCGSPGLEAMTEGGELTEAGEGRLRLTPATALTFASRSPLAPPAEKSVLLSVEGGSSVRVVEAYLDSTTSRAFSLPGTLSLPLVLQPGDEAELPVEFLPYAAGSYFGDLVVVMVEEGEERELSVALEGEGCADSDSDGSCDG